MTHQPTTSQTGNSSTTSSTTSSTDGTTESAKGARLSSPLVAALEVTWAAIQARHPELPDVVLVVGAGSVGAPRGGLKLGHFAAMRWTHATSGADRPRSPQAAVIEALTGVSVTSGTALPEVFVGGEGLARGPVDVLGTLLHEATHALAHVRGIQDTSRQGRYHNKRFQTLAAEVGLDVREAPGIGWSDTHVPQTTRDEYADVLDTLRAALTIHRRSENGLLLAPTGPDSDDPTTGTGDAPTGTTGTTSRNGISARCRCARRIRVTASVLALGPITCGVCGSPFTDPTETDPDPDDADGEQDEQDDEEAGT